MKRAGWTAMALVLSLCVLAGCAVGQKPAEEAPGAAWIAHGYNRDESVAQADGARYAFLPAGDAPGERVYLYELDENGGKRRIVCAKEGCAHEEQSTLYDPCHAYAYATRGLMAEGGALYAGSRSGQVVRYGRARDAARRRGRDHLFSGARRRPLLCAAGSGLRRGPARAAGRRLPADAPADQRRCGPGAGGI